MNPANLYAVTTAMSFLLLLPLAALLEGPKIGAAFEKAIKAMNGPEVGGKAQHWGPVVGGEGEGGGRGQGAEGGREGGKNGWRKGGREGGREGGKNLFCFFVASDTHRGIRR